MAERRQESNSAFVGLVTALSGDLGLVTLPSSKFFISVYCLASSDTNSRLELNLVRAKSSHPVNIAERASRRKTCTPTSYKSQYLPK